MKACQNKENQSSNPEEVESLSQEDDESEIVSNTTSDTSNSEEVEVDENTPVIIRSETQGPEVSVEEDQIMETLPLIQFRKVNMTQIQSESFLTLEIKASNRKIEALLDTGARISLVKKSIIDTLNLTVDTTDRARIYGIGGRDHQVVTVGSITTDIEIASLTFKDTKFQVVPDDCMDHQMFIGVDFLKANGLSVNIARSRIRYCDPNTRAQWELYVSPEEYKLIMYNLPCKSTSRVKINPEDYLVKVPVKVVYPPAVQSIPQNATTMYLYEGPLGRKLEKYAQEVAGIFDIENPFIYIKMVVPGSRIVRIGDNVGTISTVVSVDTPEGLPINVVQEDGIPLNQNADKINVGDQLTPEQRIEVFQLLNDHQGVISKGEDDVGRIDVGSLNIQLYDHTPVYHRPRRFPDPLAAEIERECDKLRAQDIIEPSLSSYNCRILPIRKPDGSLRLCMDYRDLNSKTVADRYPMTNLLDSIYSLHGFKYFTSIDLVKGYYQMEVEKNSRPYTAFSTSRGHWQYKRMPFGLKNAPSAFQRAMQIIFKEFPRNRVIVYLDDILIIEKDFEKHALLVKQVLNTLHRHGVKIKLEKCSWFKDKVTFLGHEVSTAGVNKHPSYINKIQEFPKPETVKNLQEFMGLVNWQRKFVPQCAVIGKSLYAKTGGRPKSKIEWTPEMTTAFEKLKEILIKDIQLAFPDYSKDAHPLRLYVDASATGAGACLCQRQEDEIKTILYDSCSFSDTQKRYSAIERELVAIRWGVKAFRPFLFGQHFKLYTDHQPLVYLHNMKFIDHRLARTLEDLADYDFEIFHTPGHLNQAADLLSWVKLGAPKGEDSAPSTAIPAGLKGAGTVPGGGNSMFASLIIAYEDFLQQRVKMDVTEKTLREQLITDLINNPKRFGLPTDGKFKKQLRSMLNPNVLPVPEALVAFSERYKVMVCVHYGYDRPVIFQGFTNPGKSKIHLQCLAGVHYNPLSQYDSYNINFVQAWCTTTANYYTMYDESTSVKSQRSNRVMIVDQENNELEQVMQTKLDCGHRFDGATIEINLLGGTCCALLDSGALVNLMSVDVYCQLGDVDAPLNKSGMDSLRGIGNVGTKVHGTTVQPIICQPLTIPELNLEFLVVPNHVLDTCILLGKPCLSRMDIDLDFRSQKVRHKNLAIDMGLKIYSINSVLDSGNALTAGATYHVSKSIIPGISLDVIMVDQEHCPVIKKVKELVQGGTQISDVPKKFQVYKRHWSQLNIQDGLLTKDDRGKSIPVISFHLIVDIVLKVHIQNAHIGSFKLLELLSGLVWSPSLRSVIRDACTTCSICQRNKTISRVKIPPTIKIETKTPFELVAMDLVSLPRTSEGYIGILVLVDHNTKWLAVAPIKNKRTTTIIDKLENQLFPGLVKLPTKILTDNGPEFNSLEFSDMAERLNITHIKTTANKPSSNGAVERVNRTVIDFLRSLSNGPSNWKSELPKAVQTYNNTTHNETKISPSRFIMTREHNQTDLPAISSEQRKLWEAGHPQYSSYRPGQSVLKRNYFKGRQNVDKFKSKYSGPYKIVESHGNKVTYILRDPDSDRLFKAHHVQLKPWKNPPKYIIDHLRRFPINMEKLEGEEEYYENYQEDIQEQSILETEIQNHIQTHEEPDLYFGFPNFIPLSPVRKNPEEERNNRKDRDYIIDEERDREDVNSDHEIEVEINEDNNVENNKCSELQITPISDNEVQVHSPRTRLSIINEVSEGSSSEKMNNSENSSNSEQIQLENLKDSVEQRIIFNNSVTGMVMQDNVLDLDWDVSSISNSDSSSTSSWQSLLEGVTCESCDSLSSLIKALEKLCLDCKTKIDQETSYQTLRIVPEISLDSDQNQSNSSVQLSGLNQLFKTRSLPNLADFSGFTPSDKPNKTGINKLADRLREISQGLADVRDIVLHKRKDGLDRVRKTIEGNKTRMENVRLAVSTNTSEDRVISPPFLRSRGKALDLIYIPERSVEYQIRKDKKLNKN